MNDNTQIPTNSKQAGCMVAMLAISIILIVLGCVGVIAILMH